VRYWPLATSFLRSRSGSQRHHDGSKIRRAPIESGRVRYRYDRRDGNFIGGLSNANNQMSVEVHALGRTRRNRVMNTVPKRIRARVGDVFRIPFAPDQSVFGQVIGQTGPQYLVVVFGVAARTPEDALRQDINLAAIVFDAKFRNGDWPIVANLPP
jgi:hypothetical protein